MLRSYLKKSVGSGRVSHEQIEDLVQDVLMAVHQKRGTYRTDLPIQPWLFTIARYRLIDSYRAEGRKPIVLSFEDELGLVDNIADSAHNGDTDSSSDKRDVDALLSSLTEKQRTALHLAKVEELPLAEVSSRMNMSLSAVKVTIHRALATLRRNQNSKPGRNHENE